MRLSRLPVPRPISLFERRTVLALVGVAIAVATVVVVIAVAVALGAHWIESLTVTRVVAAPLEPVAVAGLRRGVPVPAAVATSRDDHDARVLIDRRAIDAAVSVSARTGDPVEALAIAVLESLSERAAVIVDVAVAAGIPIVACPDCAVPLEREVPVATPVVLALFEPLAIAVVVGSPFDVSAVS